MSKHADATGWTVDATGDFEEWLVFDGEDPIALVYDDDEMGEGRAHMMAAAPDLLRELETLHDDYGHLLSDEARAAGEAIITRAKRGT